MPPPLDTLAMLLQAARGQNALPAAPPSPLPQPASALPPLLFSSGAPPTLDTNAPGASINPGPGQVLPPTSPMSSDRIDALEQQLLETSRAGKQWTGEQIARGRAAGDKAAALQEEMSKIPIPSTGKQWHVGKWTDPSGVEHHPSFLQNLGNILGMVGSATRPGQAIEAAYYGPRIRQYQTDVGNLAEQIKTIQEQQKLEEAPIGPTAGMIYHPFQASGSLERDRALMARAQTYAQDVKNKFQIGMAKVGIAQKLLPSEIMRNQAQAMLDSALARVAPQRIDLGYADIDLKANIASEVAQVKADQQPVFRRFFNAVLGGEMQPAPLTPGSEQPIRPEGAATGTGKSNGRRRVIDLTK